MSTSKIVNGERPGDLEGDLDYIPRGTLGYLAVAAREKKLKKRDLLVENFIDAKLGFVPESRGAITIALTNVGDKIDDIYKKTIKYENTRPEIRAKEIRAYYKSLTARQTMTNIELGHLTDANSIIEGRRYDPTTFTVGALTSSSRAMEVVALHELRASALAQSNWSSLDSDKIEKSKRDELDFMSTLDENELTVRWSAAWESINNEYTFWSSMANQTEQNIKASSYIRN
jgi:hypothetical protein